MKRASTIFMGAIISLSCLSTSLAQGLATPDSTVTLYSGLKYRDREHNCCLNFIGGPTAKGHAHNDLRYGNLYAGDELDWLQSASAQGDRSLIRDLGVYSWTDRFNVPVVEPLPKLKPGEQREISVDVSGAGADSDGKPKVDPIFMKAIVGHLYVIRVVDETRDFYALFRVDALERGDSCTISWKLIPEPVDQTARQR